jgi:hypothetical protein
VLHSQRRGLVIDDTAGPSWILGFLWARFPQYPLNPTSSVFCRELYQRIGRCSTGINSSTQRALMALRTAAALALAGCLAAGQPAAWPMLGYSASRTTRGPNEGPAESDQPTLLWANTELGGSVSPVVGVGRVFAAASGVAYALDRFGVMTRF